MLPGITTTVDETLISGGTVPRAEKPRRPSSPPEEPLLLLDSIKGSTNLDELLTTIEQNHSQLGSDEVRESLLRATKLEQEEGRSLSTNTRNRLKGVVSQHLERHITERISDYNAFSLSLCAHKLAKMRVGRKATFGAIEKEARRKLRHFQPRGLSSLLWAFAKACAEAPQLFEALDGHLQSHPGLLKKFNPQDFSNLLWAYATAGEKAPKLFEAVDAHLHKNPGLLDRFKPQEFSNLLWAYATAGEKAPKLFEAVDAHLHTNPGLLDRFKPQELSNLLWAYATAGEKAPKLFEAVDAHLHTNPGLLERFMPQNISNLLWAYATAGEKAPKLFEAVDAHLHTNPGLLDRFMPQGLSNLLWAYATAGEKAPKLFEAVEAHLHTNPRLLERFTPQNISNLLWAYAEQRHDAHGLFDAISKQMVQRMDEYGPQNLSMVLRACAVLYHPVDESVIQATLQRAKDDPNAFTPQNLANIMNAAVVFEKLDANTLKVLASAMASMELQEEEYSSVFQSCLGVQLTSPDSSPASLLPGPMHESARRLWQEQAKAFRQSGFQNNVFKVLNEQMGLKCHPEWMTPDGLFSVDIMVELPASNNDDEDTEEDKGTSYGTGGQLFTRVAVEVDGPSHFTSTRPFKALGATRLRRRLLEARVDRVVSVPFYDWDAAKSASAKRELLERLIPFRK